MSIVRLNCASHEQFSSTSNPRDFVCINRYEATNDTKAAIVERFNLRLKNKMYRYLTANNTLRNVVVLQHLLQSYSNTYHRAIGIKPANVAKENSNIFKSRLFPVIQNGQKRRRKALFWVSDYVRINRKKRIFQKQHAPTETEEVFKIKIYRSKYITNYIQN